MPQKTLIDLIEKLQILVDPDVLLEALRHPRLELEQELLATASATLSTPDMTAADVAALIETARMKRKKLTCMQTVASEPPDQGGDFPRLDPRSDTPALARTMLSWDCKPPQST